MALVPNIREVGSLSLLYVLTGNAAPTDGTSGTGAGIAEKGVLYLDTTNCQLYVNSGTQASPVWKQFTRAA